MSEVGSLAAVIIASGWTADSGCTRESNYYCIRVEPGTVTVTNADGKRVQATPPVQSFYLDFERS